MGNPAGKQKRFFTVLGVTGAVYGVFRFLLPLVVPFFVAWGLAVWLEPSAVRIARRLRVRLPRHWRLRRGHWGGKEAGKTGTEMDGENAACGSQDGMEICVPAGIVGAAECLLMLGAAGAVFYVFGRKLCTELLALRGQIPDWVDAADRVLTGVCHEAERCFSLQNDRLVLFAREMLRGIPDMARRGAVPHIMANSVAAFRTLARAVVLLTLTLFAAGFLIQELPQWRKRLRTSPFREELRVICDAFLLAANAYLRTQGILLLLICAVCTAVFWLMGNPYYLLAGLGIGLLDALPFFGTGAVLVPWAAILLFQRRFAHGLLLLALCAACYLLREFLETRMMGRKLGLSPFTELLALVVGLELFGLPGLFLGPVGFLLIRDLSALLCRGSVELSG